MFWVNPYFQKNQRHRWLARASAQLPGPVVDKANLYDVARAVDTARAGNLKAMRANLQLMSWQVKDLQAHLVQRRLNLKYNPDVDQQPRDERGRRTDGGKEADGDKKPSAADASDGGKETGALSSDTAAILAVARRLKLAGRLTSYAECLNLCYPILERWKAAGSDRNTFDFHKCMNRCMNRSL